MRVQSFQRQAWDLRPVDVDVELVPGLPHIRFLGLPDPATRESAVRLRAALRAQGFQLPIAQQVLVQLHPPQEKKALPGLDLAVAVAMLVETGQIQPPPKGLHFFGELTLRGEIQGPEDLTWLEGSRVQPHTVVSGPNPRESGGWVELSDLNALREAGAFQKNAVGRQCVWPLRPKLGGLSFSPAMARWLALASVGQHPILMVGAPGVGKSTAAAALHRLLPEVDESETARLRRSQKICGAPAVWRPFRAPHHSATPLAMVGGTQPPKPGELTRANGGLLLMDEFLEFRKEVQQALREPLETGHLTLSRGAGTVELPAVFWLAATANLCPCGHYSPTGGASHRCTCTAKARRAYVDRLGGPILDRFQIVVELRKSGQGEDLVSESEIFEMVLRGRAALRNRAGGVPNGRADSDLLAGALQAGALRYLKSMDLSLRERAQLLRVSRSHADLEGRELVDIKDLDYALELSPRLFAQKLRSI